MNDRPRYLNPSDILSHLVILHQRGVLVPFIGSGMSRPLCTSWPIFLSRHNPNCRKKCMVGESFWFEASQGWFVGEVFPGSASSQLPGNA